MSEREIWVEHRQAGKNTRRQNYLKSKTILDEKSIEYIEKANGHFIVGDFDFWATTGLFIHRNTKKRGRGIFNLLKII